MRTCAFLFVLAVAQLAQADAPTTAADERPATVLLITSANLAPAWQPFADWKTRLGKATRIVTVEAIDKQFEGADIQQKIRACVLEHAARHGTRWVVLGGDSQPGAKGHVPDRDTPHVVMGRLRYADIPTDLYYISEKSWDANGDGVYGEWKNDRQAITYTHPRASIGRIPVRTAADVRAYTEKVIGYESRYPSKGFALNMVYTCPERHAYPKLGTSRDAIASDWKAGTLHQFFGDKTPWDTEKPGDHQLDPDNWARLINARTTGKLHMHGHGFLPVWILEGNKKVDKHTVSKLENSDAYPVMTTVSCFTGQYDGDKDPSIVEQMLRQPRAGAIAIVAPSREGVPIFADPRDFRAMIQEGKMDGTTRTLTSFWQEGLANDLTIGEAFRAAKAAMAEEAMAHPGYHWCQCELNLLGDPTLDMRAKDPVTPTLDTPRTLPRGKQSLTVTVSVPRATVCLWKGDEVYAVMQADEAGKATIAIEPRSAGELLVTASGPNLNAVLASITVE